MMAIAIYSIVFLVLFGLTEYLLRSRGWAAESTRTLVHALTGIISFTFPIFLDHLWQVSLLCLSFLVLLLINEKLHLFKSISGVKRKSYGSWLFALSVLMCFYVFRVHSSVLFFYLPLAIMAFSDPFASMIGARYPIVPIRVFNHDKSLGGSLAFFTMSILLCVVPAILGHLSFGSIFIIALTATLVELISIRGWDNLTIPLIVIMNLIILI